MVMISRWVFFIFATIFPYTRLADAFCVGKNRLSHRMQTKRFSTSSSYDIPKFKKKEVSSPPPEIPTSPFLPRSPPQSMSKVTLTRYLAEIAHDNKDLREIEALLLSISMACKTISNLINRGNINQSISTTNQQKSMKRLDQLSANVLRNALRFTGKVATVRPACDSSLGKTKDDENSICGIEYDDGPSEHQPGVLIASAIDSKYVAFFDPLDGSGNAEAGISTGTIFGMFDSTKDDSNDGSDNEIIQFEDDDVELQNQEEDIVKTVLQPGKKLRAAGYCIYSSATILVFSVGNGTHGFTLDPTLGEFVLTHPSIQIPKRGSIYSCNEANFDKWPDNVKEYLQALKSGENESETKYTQRYVGSMVGDIHRTLMYGGIFFYPQDSDLHPRGNLQLVYKSNPLAYLVSQAGGLSTNGKIDLLNCEPSRIHVRSPCFIGSEDDINEMKSYVEHDE